MRNQFTKEALYSLRRAKTQEDFSNILRPLLSDEPSQSALPIDFEREGGALYNAILSSCQRQLEQGISIPPAVVSHLDHIWDVIKSNDEVPKVPKEPDGIDGWEWRDDYKKFRDIAVIVTEKDPIGRFTSILREIFEPAPPRPILKDGSSGLLAQERAVQAAPETVDYVKDMRTKFAVDTNVRISSEDPKLNGEIGKVTTLYRDEQDKSIIKVGIKLANPNPKLPGRTEYEERPENLSLVVTPGTIVAVSTSSPAYIGKFATVIGNPFVDKNQEHRVPIQIHSDGEQSDVLEKELSVINLGTRVIISGLKKDTELNGKFGTVVNKLEKNDKVVLITLDDKDDKEFKVPTKNLIAIPYRRPK